MASVTVELPAEDLAAMRLDPEGFVREMRVAAAIYWYQSGEVTQWRGAKIAGMTRLEFMDLLARRGLNVFHVDLDDLRREVERG